MSDSKGYVTWKGLITFLIGAGIVSGGASWYGTQPLTEKVDQLEVRCERLEHKIDHITKYGCGTDKGQK